ncbi:MAG: cyclin-dependent kinase inhibitor 3 family protein [Pseudomonadota bacterium]
MSPRTSNTHPFRIEAVRPPGTVGRIGMTLCPGKKQKYALTGSWDRDLASDLEVIAGWGAQALVSLMEDHEFEELGVAALPEGAAERGIDWVHLPIPDGSIPEPGFEMAWATRGTMLRRWLTAGQSIVLHCKGGLGRTGMIAARLLVEFGVEPAEAVRQVRYARPGTIETPAQEQYVYQWVPVPPR